MSKSVRSKDLTDKKLIFLLHILLFGLTILNVLHVQKDFVISD